VSKRGSLGGEKRGGPSSKGDSKLWGGKFTGLGEKIDLEGSKKKGKARLVVSHFNKIRQDKRQKGGINQGEKFSRFETPKKRKNQTKILPCTSGRGAEKR